MKRFALLLLLVTPPLWGQSVKLPAEVKVEPGTFGVVAAETDCKEVRWVVLDTGLSLIPPGLLKDSRSAVVMAGREGRYRLLAYGAKGDVPSEPVICTVVVGTPKPPDPPDPPSPNDPLYPSLKKGYDACTEGDKGVLVGTLSGLYSGMAAKVKTETYANWGVLFTDLEVQGRALGLGGKLTPLQTAIAAEFKTKFPSKASEPLTGAGKDLAATQFARVAKLLEALP